MRAEQVKALAGQCGFELVGIARAEPAPEASWYLEWVEAGMAGAMSYLAGRRGQMRADPRSLLPSARSLICVGKLYNGPQPYSTHFSDAERGWISRYAWGEDYHAVLRAGLERLVEKLREAHGASFEWKICVDTAPLLERAYARRAGLGWIGRNTCLINQQIGSWFFLGELLVSLDFEPDAPPPDRCGSCMRCIEACPTQALVPTGRSSGPEFALDARRCISYLTIELRGPIPEQQRAGIGRHVFGCDICQDVCPWNRKAPVTAEPAFAARHYAPPLDKLAALTEPEFHQIFAKSAVARARYAGFLRNVIVAMGNAKLPQHRKPLERLARAADPMAAEHARWALAQLEAAVPEEPQCASADRKTANPGGLG